MIQRLTKKIKKAQEFFNLDKRYGFEEAVEILLKMPKANFDETVEVAGRLGVNPKQSDRKLSPMLSRFLDALEMANLLMKGGSSSSRMVNSRTLTSRINVCSRFSL